MSTRVYLQECRCTVVAAKAHTVYRITHRALGTAVNQVLAAYSVGKGAAAVAFVSN